MVRAKVVSRAPAPVNTQKVEPFRNEKVNNGLSEALGFGGGPFGGNGPTGGLTGGPWGQQISQSTTMFVNLRWYLVSNFRQLLSQAYVEIAMIRTICDLPVDDALRGGVNVKTKLLEEDEIKKLQMAIEFDGDMLTLAQAGKWQRLFGGAGVLIIVEDQDPEEPLDLDSIKPGTEVIFRAVDMWELFWDKQNVEGYDAELETEEYEFYNYYARKIHKSRVLKMKGLEAPSLIRPRLRGWGVSIVEDTVRSINQYLKASNLTFEVLDEFKVDVYKIKNLINTLLSPDGTSAIMQRMQLANWQKNYQNALVMDSEDDWDHKQLSFTGLAEAQSGIRKQVCSDLRIPASKLFGSSESTGLADGTQNDLENYNSMVESTIRAQLKFHALRMYQIKCQVLFGFIPEDLELEFHPMRVLTAEQEENVKEKKFNRLKAAKDTGDITVQEFRDACNKGNLFDVHLDTLVSSVNPDDPQIDAILSGEKDEQANAEPGADKEDSEKTRNSKSSDNESLKREIEKLRDEAEKEEDSNNHHKAEQLREKARKLEKQIKNDVLTYNTLDQLRRLINSSAFDHASYEADGGDSWIQDGRRELFGPMEAKDISLYSKCEAQSEKAFGKLNWKFVVWLYKKQGGKF